MEISLSGIGPIQEGAPCPWTIRAWERAVNRRRPNGGDGGTREVDARRQLIYEQTIIRTMMAAAGRYPRATLLPLQAAGVITPGGGAEWREGTGSLTRQTRN